MADEAKPKFGRSGNFGADQIQNKPNQATSQLYSLHYGMLEHFVLQNSGSADDAADLIQDVMLVFVKLVTEEKYLEEASIKFFSTVSARISGLQS